MTDQSSDLFGKRYGEVLLINVGEGGPQATVYNSYPLNDCPAQLWDKLNAQDIAKEHGVVAAMLNGPRYWLMSSIDKVPGEQVVETFGGIAMIRQATVQLSSMNPAPYTVNMVDRRTVFHFDEGRPVFELVDPQGQRWVMQTMSQMADKTLSLDDLGELGSRLNLPAGWTYETRTLTARLSVDTTAQSAHVISDDLTNSYSLEV